METENTGRIVKVSGPLVIAEGIDSARMFDLVRVGKQKLVGEIIELHSDRASIQVYEETGGLGPGDPVYETGGPLQVELGPGLISTIYDGTQRPLNAIRKTTGDYLTKGVQAPSLDRERKWTFKPSVKTGQQVVPGDIIGTVDETTMIVHRILVPAGITGRIEVIEPGDFTVTDTVATVRTDQKLHELSMMQTWPVRRGRPHAEKLSTTEPLVTGQRVIDTLFPVAKGGTACVPGPFGSGKTVIQHQLAKWADADIIVYVGCGERGNEMTDVLTEFPELKDPRTGEPLMNRTVMIANTSNMPVAAREASIYTGVTIGEYFRDMGYTVALMADSTSRWAEAMREMSGRLEEMPGEEGYPAYLGSRVAEFYERAGLVHALGSDKREGSLTIIGAVSPPGGDLSDPVVQITLRMVKVFWGLQDTLAYKRHFPAINWLQSYSLYVDNISQYLKKEVDENFVNVRNQVIALLQKEAELEEIARLVGLESLGATDRLVLVTTRMLREDFLQQSAFDPSDAYSSLQKQFRLLKTILRFHTSAVESISRGADIEKISTLPARELIARAKHIPEDKMERFDELEEKIDEQLNGLVPSEVTS